MTAFKTRVTNQAFQLKIERVLGIAYYYHKEPPGDPHVSNFIALLEKKTTI